MSDILNYMFCRVIGPRRHSGLDASTPNGGIAECRVIAAQAERLASTAKTDAARYLELAKQCRALADEMARQRS